MFFGIVKVEQIILLDLKNFLQDYQGAISDFNKAIEINPNDADHYYNRSRSYYFLKDYYQAISDSTKAIKFNSKYEKAFAVRGISKKNIGDIKGACSDWRKASSLGNEDAAKWVRNQC